VDTSSSDSNAIDLFIRYGAAVAAVAYGLGLVEESELLWRIGIRGDFSFADPRYFAVGASLLNIPMFPALLAIAAQGWYLASHDPEGRAERELSRYTSVLSFVVTFGAIFVVALMRFDAWFRDALWVSTAGAAAGGLAAFELGRMRKRNRPGLWEQVYPLLAIAILLAAFALGAGKVHWRHVLAQQGQEPIRLLIEGETVRGAQQMGLTFPGLQQGDKSAELSGPVEIVFESERMYVLRVNGQVVRLGKGKVLGSVP
jgi:hypothetical protein